MDAHDTQFHPNHRVLDAYIKWIEQFDIRHARAWAHQYNADPEAAMCEAMYWDVLICCGATVEPNADLTGAQKAPDFVCWKDGTKFYVEVTCIRMDTVTKHTGLQHVPNGGASQYSHLNDVIFGEATSKTPQCANLDSPCVLAVGIFHFSASMLCVKKVFAEWLLTGETSLAWNFDTRLGRAVGQPFQTTNFKSASFLRPGGLYGVEPARQPISALMVAGFGCERPPVLGVLHPAPAREFDPALLARIPFCRLKTDIRSARIYTEWVLDGPDAAEHDDSLARRESCAPLWGGENGFPIFAE